MSDAARQNLKISREGIVLIKSFEGFRPRAIQREDGGWVVGYGHTLSAREGASVSEADAELLLRYDLLPIEKSVNETIPGDLNQHQFDALVSFAFSVGVDRFASSDVRHQMNAGAPREAADAMMGWPEPVLPETALRRRAAERALFVANPSAPVALSDLLAAPLLPSAVIVPFETPPVEVPVEARPEPISEPETPPAATVEPPPPVDPRGAAVAALLGEPIARIVQAEATPAPSNDNPPADPASETDAVSPPPVAEPSNDEAPASGSNAEAAAELEPEIAAETPAPAEPVVDAVAQTGIRYAPYGAPMVGPLPFLQPAALRETPAEAERPSIDHSVVETISPEIVETATVDDQITPVPLEATPAPVEALAADQAPVAELILTPLEDAPAPALERPLWTAEERDAPDGSESNLFGEDLALTQGAGSIMHHEVETEVPARFDWSDTGPFIFMGGVGLVSFGASMAAFRRAAEHSGGNELTLIGWVLALIGLACVGVSSINLYRRFGLPGGD